MLIRAQILILLSSPFIFVSLSLFHVYAQSSGTNPEIVDYHLKLAQGILDTCYTRDPTTRELIPNPTLPLFSELENTCSKKMKSLDSFLSEFVEDKDGKGYKKSVDKK